MRNIKVDVRNMEMITDENTATLHYGGIVVVSEGEIEQSFYPSGTDRDDGPWENLREFLTEKFSLDFSQIEATLNEVCDSNEGPEAEEQALFKVQDYWYLHNIGNVVELTAEPSGVVTGIKESPFHAIEEKLRAMVEKELIMLLNGPGTWFAYNSNEDMEVNFRWSEGKAVISYGENEYTFAAAVKVS